MKVKDAARPVCYVLSMAFLVMACCCLLLAFELGGWFFESMVCILLSSQLYATEVKL